MQYKISVVVYCYNDATCIKRGINSILRQTLGDIEIIVVQKNSNNKIQLILDEYVSKNDNISLATDFDLDNITTIKSDYIYFSDINDVITPNALNKMYEIARINKASVVYGDSAIVDINNNCTQIKDNIDYQNEEYKQLNLIEQKISLLKYNYQQHKLFSVSELSKLELETNEKNISIIFEKLDVVYKVDGIFVYLEYDKSDYKVYTEVFEELIQNKVNEQNLEITVKDLLLLMSKDSTTQAKINTTTSEDTKRLNEILNSDSWKAVVKIKHFANNNFVGKMGKTVFKAIMKGRR